MPPTRPGPSKKRAKAAPPVCSQVDCTVQVAYSQLHQSPKSGICSACLKVLCVDHHPCRLLSEAEFRAAVRARGAAERWQRTCEHLCSLPILQAAEMLNPTATSCKVLLPNPEDQRGSQVMRGSFNLLVPVDFDNGERWLARSPKYDAERQRLVLRAEYATLQVLRQIIPELVYATWKLPDEDRFFFLEFVNGVKLANVPATEAVDKTMLQSVAAAIDKLTRTSFTGIGSFHPTEEPTAVGPMIHRTPWLPDDKAGPFRTFAECYTFAIEFYLATVASWSFIRRRPQYSDSQLLRAYLCLIEIRTLVATCEEFAQEQKTFIRHPDLHLGNMIYRPDGQVKAIIDWEGAYTAPLAEVAVPGLYDWVMSRHNPRDLWEQPFDTLPPPALALRDEYISLGRDDLAAAVLASPKYLVLTRLFQFPEKDWVIDTLILNPLLLWRLRVLFLGGVEAGEQPSSWEEWEHTARKRHGDDEGFKALEAKMDATPQETRPGYLRPR